MAATTAQLKTFPSHQGVETTLRRVIVTGPVTIGASPLTYTTGGIPLNWRQISNSLSGTTDLLNTNQLAPIMAWFNDASGSGYNYQWNKVNNTLQIFTTGTSAQAPDAELTGGSAIPAAVSSAIIDYEAKFTRSVV